MKHVLVGHVKNIKNVVGDNMLADMLYFIGGALWAVEMIPQISRTYKRKSVEDISIWFPVICIISFILVFVAHSLLHRWTLLLSQVPPLICNLIFLGQVITYRKKALQPEIDQIGNA